MKKITSIRLSFPLYLILRSSKPRYSPPYGPFLSLPLPLPLSHSSTRTLSLSLMSLSVSLSHYLSLYLYLSLSVSSPSLDCLPACLSFSLSIPLSISLYLPLCHTHYFFLSSLTFIINSPSNSCLVDSTSTPLKATSLLRSSSCV